MLAIYRRVKDSATGRWRGEKVKEGRGIRTSSVTGSFYVRPWINGVQERRPLHSTTFAEAKVEAQEAEQLFEAQSKGLTSGELSAVRNAHRIPVKTVVDTYLAQKTSKAKKDAA